MIRRSSKILLEVVGVAVAGSAILLGLLAWRLASGPVEADFLAPYLESAMSDTEFRLSIGGTLVRWDGFSRPLAFVATDLRVEDRDGKTVATVPQIELALDVPGLFAGHVVPQRMNLVRPELRVTRTESGELTILLGDVEPVDEGGAGEDYDAIGSLLESLRAAEESDVPMASLGQLEITGAEIFIDDRLLDVTWVIPRADIDLSRADDAIRGGMLLDLQLGDRLAALTAELDHSLSTGKTELELGLANFVPAELAGLDPLLEPLATVAIPVFGTITAEFAPALKLDRVAFVLQGGAGQLRVEDVYELPLPVAGLTLSGLIDVGADRMVIDRFSVDLGGPSVSGSATITDITGVLDVNAEALVEELPMDLLATYWPVSVATDAREWVTGNLSLGMLRSAGASISARIPADALDEAEVSKIEGTIAFDGIRVNYLDGLPPVHEVAGVADFDATTLTLAISAGHLRDLSLTGADIAITGLDRPIEMIDIELVLSGPARTALEVVDSPGLEYISELGIDPSTASGKLAGRTRFTFPLISDLAFDQVAIATAANLIDVGISGSDLGTVRAINGTLNLDGRGMTIKGDATVAEIPLSFEWVENFVDDREYRSRFVADGNIGKADAERIGLDFYDPWTGTFGVHAVYTDLDRQRATATAELDLAGASITLDEIGWRKSEGEPGTAVFELALVDDRLIAIPSFAIDGSGLDVGGSAVFDPDSGDVSDILLTEFRYGETDLTAELTSLPNGGYAVNAHGPKLDARPLLEGASLTGAQAEPSSDEPAASDGPPVVEPAETAVEADPAEGEGLTPLQVTVAFDEVIASERGSLYGVSGLAARDSQGWNEFDLVARTDTGGQVQSRYEPIRPAGHQFSLTADDAGAALRALDFTGNVRGGQLSVTGVQAERSGPLEGSIDLRDYLLVEAPALSRILAALSLGGLQNVLSTEGLRFEKLTGEYSFADDMLALRNVRTAGGAMGLTLNGEVDLDAALWNVQGTIVPIYGVNQLIGAIPILGNLLTGGSGQGIFAFAYSVKGPLREPEVAVNPLSVLAPGFLRNLFFLDSSLGQPESDQPPPPPRLNDDD